MKKSILSLGKVLNKTQQKKVNGGYGYSSPKECYRFCDKCSPIFYNGDINFVCA